MFITFRQLRERGLCVWSRAHLDRLEAEGKTPKRVRLGQGRVAWVLEEWIDHNRKLIEKRDAAIP
jgi:predicted DNA-binding transcriptional regulator AlpA